MDKSPLSSDESTDMVIDVMDISKDQNNNIHLEHQLNVHLEKSKLNFGMENILGRAIETKMNYNQCKYHSKTINCVAIVG